MRRKILIFLLAITIYITLTACGQPATSGIAGKPAQTTDADLVSETDNSGNEMITPVEDIDINEGNVDFSADYNYSPYDDGTAIITGYVGEGGDVIIPSRIDGYLITQIGSHAFSSQNITSIVIPDSVTTIEGNAFEYSSAQSIVLPDSITELGSSVFANMSHLKTIEIPDSVVTIGPATFFGSGLESISIPNSVTSILGGTFDNCKYLTSVTLPDGITKIEGSTFSHCEKLTSITIPDSVTEIGACAFFRCKSLTSIVIPDGVTTIGFDLFYECENLTSVTIPASVTDISASAGGRPRVFYGCRKLTIHCPPGSAMEQYAIKNQLNYVTE